MKRWLFFILFIFTLVLAGCSLPEELIFWQGEEKEQKRADVPEQVDQEKQPENRDISIITAERIEGQKEAPVYAPADYAKIGEEIQKSTLDNYLQEVLGGERGKVTDNPYLIGERVENSSMQKAIMQLEDNILRLNPANWKVIKVRPVKEDAMLVRVQYILPDGRTIVAQDFTVKHRADNWFIDFASFSESVEKAVQVAAAGKGPANSESGSQD